MLKNDSYRAINEAIKMSARKGFQIAKFNISKNITNSVFHIELNDVKNVLGYVSINKANASDGICVNIGYSMLDEYSEIYVRSYEDVTEYTRLDAEHTDTIYVLYIPSASRKTEAVVLKHIEFRVYIETLRHLANSKNERAYADIYKWITKNPSFLDE